MKELKDLFKNNAKWVAQKTAQDPEYFTKLARDQTPRYLWIGCSDSRVPATEILSLQPGELFVHRNVANIFPHTDFNCLSVLEFAVNVLKIKHVIVCGHYGCSGITAAMQKQRLGAVDNWLRHIRDVYVRHKEELDAIKNEKKRAKRLVERNVLHQVLNVCHTSIVQEAWAREQPLYVHGWVYDMESGRLKDLDRCYSSSDQLESIHRIALE